MKITLKILPAFLAAMLVGCLGEHNVNETIDEAINASSTGNYAAATALCNSLTNSADSARLNVSQLCRLGMVYVEAADHDHDTEANMAAAVRCFDAAVARNVDSVAIFVQQLPPQKASAAITVLALAEQQNIDLSQFTDPEDPTHIIDTDIDPHE